ncbi:MAG: hypothetical protein HUU46_06025 [Candidatus Hydrogenedentes bacterium]|nr:hypothetical protein [Candidatus Hydrogenedentota bacterium]
MNAILTAVGSLLLVVGHAQSADAAGPVLGIDGFSFTLNDKPVFLLGASYYGALGSEREEFIEQDMDDFAAHGFNWVRVWATWADFDNNVSAVATNGLPRQPYMARLERLCELASVRGIVVDVTVTRGKPPAFPSNFPEHLAVMNCLAKGLKRFRNVYFDIGNERNVGDERHVPIKEVGDLVRAVKQIDPDRLCTASDGGDLSKEATIELVEIGGADFICPHRARVEESPMQTAGTTRAYRAWLTEGAKAVPVHYQEPFRRDYGNWNPTADDFMTDLENAKDGGAAGWCFHNGANSLTFDKRPRRSFDMRAAEGRLFDQLDKVEKEFLSHLRAAVAKP